MGLHIVKMPDIGEGIAEVELVAWHVSPGDEVNEDQSLADVMTDKASVEIPSPVAGRVRSLGGNVGEIMAVGSALITIETETASPDLEPPAEGQPHRQDGHSSATSFGSQPDRIERAHSTNGGSPASGSQPLHQPDAVSAQLAPRTLASPAVRRRAQDAGAQLRFIAPSGPAGQVTHADLDRYLASSDNSSVRYSPPRSGQRSDEMQVPVIGLRRKIAQRMQESKRRIPHFSYVEECDVTELEALREAMNRRWGVERGRLTPLPFIAKAMVLAMAEFPQINARFDDEAGYVTRYGAVHLGVAAQTDSGLVVPVVRHAECLSIWQLAQEIGRLAEAARSSKATRDELLGSTITLTSLGALGGIASTPVINHPEVAIVGVNRIVQRPMFKDGVLAARLLMNLSSSFDHRVVDGMDAARFIQSVRGYLETPALLFAHYE